MAEETKRVAPPNMEAELMTDTTPHGMMMLALRSQADPVVLGRLMDLQERWDAMQAKKAYVEAITAFKKEVPAVLNKDGLVDFETSKGHTTYRHATLGGIVHQITPSLSAHGLSVAWETEQSNNAVKVTCHVTHAKGHRESVALVGPRDESGNKNAIQGIGSAVTYLQRYTLLAALGLATAEEDDDDGGKPPPEMPRPVKRVPVEKPKPPTPRPPSPATNLGDDNLTDNGKKPPADPPEFNEEESRVADLIAELEPVAVEKPSFFRQGCKAHDIPFDVWRKAPAGKLSDLLDSLK